MSQGLFNTKMAKMSRPEQVVKVDQAPDEPQMSSRPYDLMKPTMPAKPINYDMSVQHVHARRK